jgi:paxillin
LFFFSKPILSESISALGKLFHPEHFVCQTCQSPLGTSQFYEQNGNPQCERCYSSIFCPMCAYCNTAISDRCLTAMNKKWHVDCFVCNNCCQPFQGGRFFENNGMPYCQGCFEKTFMTRCAGCSQNVSGRIINAMAQQWHQECFVCSYCRRSLVGLPFYEKEGKPFCEAHYFAASTATCAACRQPIQGRCVDALGKKFHPEHFICTYCMNPLAGGGHTEQNGQPYCLECYANVF